MDLHCVICVEEFDLKERQPVVLPCGHTYVCKVCVGKLKICHECREPLYWNPPRPPQQPLNNIHRSPATARYSRYNQRYAPSTPPHPSTTAPREEVHLPCPKNVVLMEMIEAKQRQERIMQEQKAIKEQKRNQKLQERERKRQERREEKLRFLRRQADMCPGSTQPQQHSLQAIEVDILDKNLVGDEDDEEDYDYDDEISSSSSSALPLGEPDLNSGYAALSGTCGTYVVKEREGLVVLPADPNRQNYQRVQEREIMEQHAGDEKKEEDEYHDISRQFSSLFINDDDDEDDEDTIHEEHDESMDTIPPISRKNKEPFSIEEGQKVQVVGVLESSKDEGIYQLARGMGYIVATPKQLVKIGGPLETSCQLEGMLQSVLEKQQETQRKLNEITNMAVGLKKKIILEQGQPEEVPVITLLVQKKSTNSGDVVQSASDGSNNTATGSSHNDATTVPHPTTPKQSRGYTNDTSPAGGSALGSVASVDSTVVELGGGPRTPGPPTNGSHLEYHPIAAAQMRQQDHFAYSPARSCPMPVRNTTDVHLDQPYLDDDTPSGTGVLRYRVNSDDEMSGMGWAGVLGCGSSLFGERLMDSTQQRETNTASNIFNAAASGTGDHLMRFALDESNVQRRAAALAQVAAGSSSLHRSITSSGSADSPLRRGGSFDGGTGGGVNFRGGYSNHGGLGRTRRVFGGDQQTESQNTPSGHNRPIHTVGVQEPRRQLMMSQMSQHRGVGSTSIPRRTGHPDTLLQSTSR